MAKKEFPLAILLKAVDRATAPLRRVTQGLQRLSTKSGLPVLRATLRSTGATLKRMTVGFGAMAAAAGLGTVALKGQINQLDGLAKTAGRLGFTVDALAELRFAAGQTGTSAAELDRAMEGFSKRLGEARAGTGSLFTFLQKVSPALLSQVEAAKSNEDALGLMADALAKIKDPARRAALEAAAFGRTGAQLDNLLKTGSSGIDLLRREYAGLAGSQEGAARASEKINDAMARITAVFAGVRSGIVEALAPAFLKLTQTAKVFFADNRDSIVAFARDFGKTLPKRLGAFVAAMRKVIDVVTPIWEAMGGLRTAAIALGAVLGVKLIFAIKALSLALVTTPFGLILTGIAGLVAAGVLLVRNWDTVKAFLLRIWEPIRPIFETWFRWVKFVFLNFSPLGRIIKHWDPIKRFFGRLWTLVRSPFLRFLGWVKDAFLNFTPLGRIIKHWKPIKAFFGTLWDGVTAVFSAAWDVIKAIVDKISGVVDTVLGAVDKVTGAVGAVSDLFFGDDEEEAQASAVSRAEQFVGPQPQSSISRVFVDFANLPRGARVNGETDGPASLDLSTGYQLAVP